MKCLLQGIPERNCCKEVTADLQRRKLMTSETGRPIGAAAGTVQAEFKW